MCRSAELSFHHIEAEHLQCVLGICCFCCLQISFGFLVSVYYALCILILFLFLNTFAGPNDVYQIEIWNLSHFRNVVLHEAISAWTHMVYGIIYPLIHFHICSLSNRNELKWSNVVLAMFCSDNLVNVFCCFLFRATFRCCTVILWGLTHKPKPRCQGIYLHICIWHASQLSAESAQVFSLTERWQTRDRLKKKPKRK